MNFLVSIGNSSLNVYSEGNIKINIYGLIKGSSINVLSGKINIFGRNESYGNFDFYGIIELVLDGKLDIVGYFDGIMYFIFDVYIKGIFKSVGVNVGVNIGIINVGGNVNKGKMFSDIYIIINGIIYNDLVFNFVFKIFIYGILDIYIDSSIFGSNESESDIVMYGVGI